MEILKTYDILTDVNKKAVDSDLITQEIKDSGFIDGYNGVTIGNNSLNVLGDSINNETSLDALVFGHVAVSLNKYKKKQDERGQQEKRAKSFLLALSTLRQVGWCFHCLKLDRVICTG